MSDTTCVHDDTDVPRRSRFHQRMIRLIACPDPQCGAPAEVCDEILDHVKSYCARRHVFVLPMDYLRRSVPTNRDATPGYSPASRPAGAST